MGLLKPKGKHAQGAHVQPADKWSNEAAETEAKQEQEPAEGSAELAVDVRVPVQSAGETVAFEEQQPDPDMVVPEWEQPQFSDETAVLDPLHRDYASMQEGAFAEPYVPGGFAPVTADGVVLRKKHRVGKVLGITFGIIIGLLLVAYIAGAVVFMGRFFPNTVIAGNDVSMMANEEVVELLDRIVDEYALDVVGTDFTYGTTAEEIDLSIDAEGVVDAMHAELNAWTWPALLLEGSHDVSDALVVTFKKQNYDYKLVNAVSAFNKDAVAPVDATIAYDEKTKKFKIVDEVPGTQYDSHVILAAMEDAVAALEPKVKLTSDFLVQPNVFSTDERLRNSAELATGLVSAHVTLTMAGKTVSEIDGGNLSSFIRMDENLGVTLDEAAIDQWVTDLSNGFDTVGTERTYTRPDGKVITISGGAYGWSTDAPALKDQVVAAIKAGETATVDIPCEQTAFAYNGPGQPDWGNRYIDVDLSEQYVRFYGDDGSIIWESACISGTPDGQHNTWPGVWYITNKESPSKLIGYLPSGKKEYETTVSFWMAFEGNGIGLHDATWQPSFGGSMYMNGYGSHGCVNLSYSAAESLYGICNLGDVVIAHY